MIGLFLSEAILFAVAAILGFAVGAYLYARSAAERRRTAERDNEQLRAALTEVQVRRARGS
ncbi:MAG: hypothetical protein A4S17_05525 [Proteobacteria bacterium HN_bin10]|jgi:hypothetical protein|nr:MAG: hypothetical protein A4S17_05525 [Proteobacteria bacterium HN_bin10]